MKTSTLEEKIATKIFPALPIIVINITFLFCILKALQLHEPREIPYETGGKNGR